MATNHPFAVTHAELDEMSAIQAVREMYGLEDGESLSSGAYYVARFDYAEDSPGYAGDFYVLLGGTVDAAPLCFFREAGQLQLLTD